LPEHQLDKKLYLKGNSAMEDFNYDHIVQQIKATFPQGTVQKRQDTQRAYIPNQVYTDRVELATQSRWSREIRDVEINIPHGFVKVIARVMIGAYYRDGIGFAEIGTESAGKAKQIANKVDQAGNEAVREALDTWQIGWRDLAPYYQQNNDWGTNPALRHLLETSSAPTIPGDDPSQQINAKVERFCIKCLKQLSHEEWEILGKVPNLNRDKMTYCFEDLPNHLKKKLPQGVLDAYVKNHAVK
jgi:hypothetical protein